mgnify:CR=1 FL=1
MTNKKNKLTNGGAIFKPIYEDLFRFKPKLTPYTIIIYGVICGYYDYFIEKKTTNRLLIRDGKTYLIFPQIQLAKLIGCSRNTVSKSITSLEKCGLLTVYREYTSDFKEINYYLPNNISGRMLINID